MSTNRKSAVLSPPSLPVRPPVILPRTIPTPTIGRGVAKNLTTIKKTVLLVVGIAATILFFVAIALIFQVSPDEKNTQVSPDEKNATERSDSFQVDYKVVDGGYCAGLEAIVRGKAAKLAVILTSPNGESRVEVIESDNMITNCATVKLPLEDPQPGTHVLTVKTFFPEEVVCRKEVSFSLNQLMVEDVKFNLIPKHSFMGNFVGNELMGLEITLNKDGNLPIEFSDVSVTVGDEQCLLNSIESGGIMIGQRHLVKVSLFCAPTQKMLEYDARRGGLPWQVALFRSGDRYPIKGRLLFSKDREKFVEFEKELVVQ